MNDSSLTTSGFLDSKWTEQGQDGQTTVVTSTVWLDQEAPLRSSVRTIELWTCQHGIENWMLKSPTTGVLWAQSSTSDTELPILPSSTFRYLYGCWCNYYEKRDTNNG